jgi:hypothetical protein
MMGRRHAVNDPGGRGFIGGNEIIRIQVEDKGFIPLTSGRATASFLFLDRSGRVSR